MYSYALGHWHLRSIVACRARVNHKHNIHNSKKATKKTVTMLQSGVVDCMIPIHGF